MDKTHCLRFVCVCLLAMITVCAGGCSSLKIVSAPSVAVNQRVNSLVLHFTAENYITSLYLLKDSGYVSSHYLVPTLNDSTYPHSSIRVMQLVNESARAWHAGHSYWQGRSHLNDTSIGIEIVNQPRCAKAMANAAADEGEFGPSQQCEFPDFGEAQINTVVALVKDILVRHPDITPTKIVGHSDIAPQRKNDPGPSFPWFYLYQQGIGAWYEKSAVQAYQTFFTHQEVTPRMVQEALSLYGYDIELTGEYDKQTSNVIYAFQSHFLPNELTGSASKSTVSVLFALLARYFPDKNEALLLSHVGSFPAY